MEVSKMAGLLSGLASLGLGNLEEAKIFEEPQKEEVVENVVITPEVMEKDLIYDRAFDCPVCASKIKSKIMKSGKAKLVGTDSDLRPKYEGIDPIKYDVILCPKCGFSALSRYFKVMPSTQVKLIKEKISKNFRMVPHRGEIYTYEDAVERYKLALACSIVKQGKASEKAYICLKTAWVLRGQSENLDPSASDYKDKKAELESGEEEFLKAALEGFTTARQSEDFPMCGMDESTIDYLMAVLATRFDQYEMASKLVATILTSTGANARMKDKARELKNQILQALKQNK